MSMLMGHPIVETDGLDTPPVVFGGPLLEPDNIALRVYRLWRKGLLPAGAVVIKVSIARTGYGDFRITDCQPRTVMVAHEDRNPAPDDRIKVSAVELRDFTDPETGDALVLGWNEDPPRLIVGTERRR